MQNNEKRKKTMVAADNVLEIVIRFEIDAPYIAKDDNAEEVAKTVYKLLVAKISDALGELKEQYDITVRGFNQ